MIWFSPSAPKVTTPKACVCPLVNNAEPCVRFRTSTLENSGLISSTLRPSGLTLSSVINLLNSFVTMLSTTVLTCWI